ncbi:hypothetical protein HMPREF0556_10784 [Listeria grayi DSM 20601]|uniref:Uncharacterized protein n=1 Tax=Listeria grayi DSM 20601 TaxID=525367 RepID=D7UX23_LISGR|nr:hypothetical protein HMPREF0556_10784 [Listeria grayi DSM 20601]
MKSVFMSIYRAKKTKFKVKTEKLFYPIESKQKKHQHFMNVLALFSLHRAVKLVLA